MFAKCLSQTVYQAIWPSCVPSFFLSVFFFFVWFFSYRHLTNKMTEFSEGLVITIFLFQNHICIFDNFWASNIHLTFSYSSWELQSLEATVCCCCRCLVPESHLTVCDPADCSPTHFSAQGISQARILEWVAISSSRRSSRSRDQTHIPALAAILYHSATREALWLSAKQWNQEGSSCFLHICHSNINTVRLFRQNHRTTLLLTRSLLPLTLLKMARFEKETCFLFISLLTYFVWIHVNMCICCISLPYKFL